jgi:hypothetical protein
MKGYLLMKLLIQSVRGRYQRVIYIPGKHYYSILSYLGEIILVPSSAQLHDIVHVSLLIILYHTPPCFLVTSDLVFLVLPCVGEAGYDGGHSDGGGNLTRVDHNEKLH